MTVTQQMKTAKSDPNAILAMKVNTTRSQVSKLIAFLGLAHADTVELLDTVWEVYTECFVRGGKKDANLMSDTEDAMAEDARTKWIGKRISNVSKFPRREGQADIKDTWNKACRLAQVRNNLFTPNTHKTAYSHL